MAHLDHAPQRSADQNSKPGPWRPARGAVAVVRELFPEPERGPKSPPEMRFMMVACQVAAVAVSAFLLLERIPGKPAWTGIYEEDLYIFLVESLQHPVSHLLTPYGGYLQLGPQLIGQFAAMLPLPDAAAFFAICGAVIASACALFVFHASAGHIRSPLLRSLLSLAVLLLPVAPIEIIDSGVDMPWYLMFALFWAALWRPRTRSGAAVAALIAFFAVTSNGLALIFAPLLLLRVIALPRLREQGVTIGWAVGALAQLPYVLHTFLSGHSRVTRPAAPGQAAAFYGHDVVLPSISWHLSWVLRDNVGTNTATLLVGSFLIVVFGFALVTLPRPGRVFILTALVGGFLLTMIAATATRWVTTLAVSPTWEPGSRYTSIPILLLDAAAIVAVDYRVRHVRLRHVRPSAIVAATALVAVLAVGWVGDYRYLAGRAKTPAWAPIAARWLHTCRLHPTGIIDGPGLDGAKVPIPCANLRRLPEPPTRRRRLRPG